MAGKQPAGPDRQKKRGACGGRAVGVAVSISLLASLPHAHAALSISSGAKWVWAMPGGEVVTDRYWQLCFWAWLGNKDLRSKNQVI